MARLRLALPWAVLALAAVVVVAGPLLRSSGVVLGTPLPPFLGPFHVLVDPPAALVAAVVLVAAVLALPALLRAPVATFALGSLAATLVVRLAVNAARTGTGGWYEVFDPLHGFEGKNEYLPALGSLQYGPRLLLDRFDELIPTLPAHAAAHPPGTLLLLDGLGITSPGAMAALVIGAGAVATPVAYFAFRRVSGEATARVATLLLVLSPDAILYGVTSADALFLLVAMLSAWPLAAWVTSGSRGALALAAAGTVIASFFAWSLPAVTAWAAILAWRRDGVRRAVVLAAACAGAAAVGYGALYLATGYDVVHSFLATEDIYRFSVASKRPYWFWVLGSPVAFLVMAGLPVAWLALRALARGQEAAVAIAWVIGVAALLGFTKAETERIWLYLTPLLCLAAAPAVPAGRLRVVLGLLAAQALAVEVLLGTVW